MAEAKEILDKLKSLKTSQDWNSSTNDSNLMSNTSDIRVSNDGGQKVIKFSIVIINLLHNFSDSPFNEVTLSCHLKLP